MFRRILMAAAGYWAYRWWNRRSDDAPARKTVDARPIASPADADLPRRN